MSAKQIGPLTGILFVALVVAAFIVGGETPDTNDSVQKVVSFYTDNDSQQMIAAVLLSFGAAAYLFFLGTLRQVLRRVPGDEGGLSTVMMLGGLMQVAGLSLFAGLTFTLGDAADDISGTATQAIHVLNNDLFLPLAVGTMVFNLALALAVLRHGGLPRWIGWVSLVIGIASLTPLGFFGFLADGILIVIISVILTRAAGAAPAAATPAATGGPVQPG
jgi:hypothetical protein